MTAPAIDWDALRCSEEEWRAAKDRTAELAPRVLLPGWRRLHIPAGSPWEGMGRYEHVSGLHVLMSCGQWDGRWWLHVSVTARGRVPFYGELCEVKDLFVGRERQAVQVFPPRSKHINRHPFCLHLWACLEPDGDGLPEFGRHGTI